MKLTAEHLLQINNILIRKLGVESKDLCFCGSVEIHENCCAHKANFWISDAYFEKLVGYAKHNNFFVSTIPSVFLNDFNKKYQKQFNRCANPECLKPSIGSHVFGESLVRKHFDSDKCQWYMINDSRIKTLCSAGVRNDIKYPIFCGSCDNTLFKDIDLPEHSVTDNKNIFLHLFRCMSFQYQFTRENLALAHQLAFGSVKIAFERQKHTKNFRKNEQININHLVMSYVGYKYHYEKINQLWKIYKTDTKSATNLRLHNRVIGVKEPIFAQGVLNPKVDLKGEKINFVNPAGIIYVVLPMNNNFASITIATLDDEYYDYIEQLNSTNDYVFKKLTNGFIAQKNSQYNLLLSPTHKLHQKALM